uniref:Ribosomal RNA methyltransferase putative n=1 Tax=Albugo laibachii Nc14 TaxID=890382 RepID=F0W0G7_9STRA|nr:ribosomal RNA methyltransferase putative [Albugo laibachii Nc14]|eukprot:CCA14539.1 ribosomal RNA methyltransferase putative [Albugo laibachii Nc14]
MNVRKTTTADCDVYYRRAKELKFRARSAFKLLQLDDQFDLFNDVQRAVDLCAAPGSWSQVLSRKLYSERELLDLKQRNDEDNESLKIVSVDLQETAPIPGVKLIQGDITSEKTVAEIARHFRGRKAQIVVCDGAPDVTGMHDVDEFLQAELLHAALNVSAHVLEEGGTFVAKIFHCKQYELLASQFALFFANVSRSKPESSRVQSNEAFIIGQQFRLPNTYKASISPYSLAGSKGAKEGNFDPILVPYMASGDLSGYDNLQKFA